MLFALLLAAAAAGAMLSQALDDVLLTILLVAAVGVVPVVWLAGIVVHPVSQFLRAMSGAVASYRDGDFSISLAADRSDEFGELMAAHNELGRALREQRAYLVQRELLLDTVTQNSPVALVLVDPHQRVAYANLAARHLFNEGRSLLGQDFSALLSRWPESLRAAANAGADSLFSAEMEGVEEVFHLSQRSFLLQGRPHRLYLLKRLTRELSRQEVAIWKKLIRVLSHELNNSLAPISSLAHSGIELARRGDISHLTAVLATIRERTQHLHQFIASYATFARLPAPHVQAVDWRGLADDLVRQQPFRIAGPLPVELGWFDRLQLEQALINLLKNAHEAGGPAEEIELAISQSGIEQRVEVRDRGAGMTEAVLAQALLPFYSTKRSGTGLGLALAREIAEAHGGCIRLNNRENGGLCATLILPLPAEHSAR